MLFRFDRIGKEFSGEWLFQNVSAQLNPGERVGLIGRNGVGKTTLFEMIEDRLKPDAGHLHRASDLSVSRVEQIPDLGAEAALLEEALEVFDDLKSMEERLRDLEHRIADHPHDRDAAHEYEHLHTRFDLLGGYEYPARTESVLFGLGFRKEQLGQPCGTLSGGQRSRLALARALLRPSRLLLLDEPTNHLDLEGILWLQDYLRSVTSALIVISHDRSFLDVVTERTWEMEAGTLYDYPAAFTPSRRLRDERIRLEREAYEKQQEWRRKTEDFVRRNIAGQKTRQAQSRRKQLEKAEWVEAPEGDLAAPVFRIPEAPRGGNLAVECRDVDIGYEGTPLLERVSLTISRGERVGILGGNGSGKTTLLRTLVGEIPPVGGSVRWGLNNIPAYFSQEARFEGSDRTVYDVLTRLKPSWSDEEIRSFGARFGFRGDDIGKEVLFLSGGERSRLALARLLSTSCNVLILDEPTNHLDIHSREALEEAVLNYDGALIVVSHDLYFLDRVVERFFLIRGGRMEEVRGLAEVKNLLTAREVEASPQKKSPPPSSQERAGLSKNERMRAEKRLRDLELEIHALEKRRTDVEKALHTGSEDHVRLRELARLYENLNGELARLYQDWEELGAVLEEGTGG